MRKIQTFSKKCASEKAFCCFFTMCRKIADTFDLRRLACERFSRLSEINLIAKSQVLAAPSKPPWSSGGSERKGVVGSVGSTRPSGEHRRWPPASGRVDCNKTLSANCWRFLQQHESTEPISFGSDQKAAFPHGTAVCVCVFVSMAFWSLFLFIYFFSRQSKT